MDNRPRRRARTRFEFLQTPRRYSASRTGLRPSAVAWAGLVTATTVLGGLMTGAGSPASGAETIRVMMLGDSITAAEGCWRIPISKLMLDGRQVDMVGSQNNSASCGGNWDGDHEGYSGITAAEVATGRLTGWLDAARPDVVGVYLGTNDVWQGRATGDIVESLDSIVGQIRERKADTRVLVAQLPPLAPSGCDTCTARTAELDDAIASWAGGAGVDLVDLRPDWAPQSDTIDGVHPNQSGTDKLASRWVASLGG